MRLRGIWQKTWLIVLVSGAAQSAAQDTATVGAALQRLEIALYRNMPKTASCRIEVALTRPDSRRGFADAARLTPLLLRWKSPSSLRLSLQEENRTPTTPPDPSCTFASRGPYFETRIRPFLSQINKMTQLNQINGVQLDPVQAILMSLRGDAEAKALGRTDADGTPAICLDFPNAGLPMPMGLKAQRLKLWLNEKDGMPRRMRFFTQRQGVVTYEIRHEPVKDEAGLEYLLPAAITLWPAEREDVPSAAYPVRVYFRNYELNKEIADEAFTQ